MADYNAPPGWTDAQWQKVQDAVTDSFAKASVVSSFLPCYGPLPEGSSNVRNPQIDSSQLPDITVDDAGTLRFLKLRADVQLSREQVADESLSSALLLFKRAATLLAQAEDALVFLGLQSNNAFVPDWQSLVENLDSVPDQPGLFGLGNVLVVERKQETLVSAIVTLIDDLDRDQNPGPFACVLASDVFALAHTSVNPSLVMPADRIRPMLAGGPLLRCGQMSKGTGVIVSLASDLVDVVVATPPRVALLQVNTAAKFVFRVYEKFVLRVKDRTATPVRGLILDEGAKSNKEAKLARESAMESAMAALAVSAPPKIPRSDKLRAGRKKP